MPSSTDHDGPTGAPLQLPYFVMDAGIVPMLVPPQPWVSVTEGGYLLTPGELWRELWGVRMGAHLKRFSLPRHLSCSVLVYAAHTCMHALVSPALHCPPLLPTYVSSHMLIMFAAPTARIVRCQEDTYQHQLLMERAENLAPVYDALDYVSSCPWKINSRVSMRPHAVLCGK